MHDPRARGAALGVTAVVVLVAGGVFAVQATLNATRSNPLQPGGATSTSTAATQPTSTGAVTPSASALPPPSPGADQSSIPQWAAECLAQLHTSISLVAAPQFVGIDGGEMELRLEQLRLLPIVLANRGQCFSSPVLPEYAGPDLFLMFGSDGRVAAAWQQTPPIESATSPPSIPAWAQQCIAHYPYLQGQALPAPQFVGLSRSESDALHEQNQLFEGLLLGVDGKCDPRPVDLGLGLPRLFLVFGADHRVAAAWFEESAAQAPSRLSSSGQA